MILVSACLLGVGCRYDGIAKMNKALMGLAAKGELIPVCPEQLGGCPTPRQPSEIAGGTGADVLAGRCPVKSETGEDVTESFIKGARETLKIAKACKVKRAILKARSPSCGFGKIYDGSFKGVLINGNGVTAELLNQKGIEIFSEETMDYM